MTASTGVNNFTVFGASRVELFTCVSVTECGYNFLLNDNFTTNRAVFTFGKACCSAGGCNCCVDYFGMTLCFDYFFITVTASTGVNNLTCFGASCIGCFWCVGMTECGHNFLLNENFTANRAMFTFGKAGCSAGGRNRCVDYFGMAGCGFCFGLCIFTNWTFIFDVTVGWTAFFFYFNFNPNMVFQAMPLTVRIGVNISSSLNISAICIN